MWKRTRALAVALALLLGVMCVGCDEKATNPVISEVMAQNSATLMDDDGEYVDWIELYNPTDAAIDLTGYSLTDDANQPRRYVFDGITLQPGEYWVVYASGKDRTDAAARVVHLPFSLKSTGETVYLYDSNGTAVSCVTILNLEVDVSCGIDGKGNVVYFEKPTPGTVNGAVMASSGTVAVTPANVTVRLNEYATSDTVTLADAESDFSGWVELYNSGESAIDLTGFALSDDTSKNDKWVFPQVAIPAGGYLVVFLSGKEVAYTEGGELHATFKLSGEEETLTLYDSARRAVDSCVVHELVANLTCGRPESAPASWQFFARATPGAANTVAGFDEIDSARYPANKSLAISEVAAVNRSGVTAADGERYDFVELYNPTGEPVSLAGYRLSGNTSAATACALPEVTLAAGEYFVVWCGAESAGYNAATGEQFADFGITRSGETIYLFDEAGAVVDSFASGRLDDGQSCGRVSKTDDRMWYFATTTPAAANPDSGVKGPVATPVFSEESGYLAANTAVSITCPDATIHYTTDGSLPTEQSPVYTGPITVSQTMTIRAKAYREGSLPSDDSAGSYIVGSKHTLPVIFLSTNPDYLFDEQTGMFANGPGYTETFPHTGANYWKDWERPVHVQYVDENGQAQLEFNAGIKVFGQYSRAQAQKSVSINLRDKYGVNEVCYPFFGESGTNVYSELVLRNSGQDIDGAHIRDAFTAMAVKDQMDLDIMDYQPVVVYLNGEYYGLYDLREKICEAYVTNRTGAEESDVDMIKGNSILMSGSNAAYEELLTYVEDHDLTKSECYDYVCSRIDEDELINYWICESFFNNTDTGNIKFYRVGEDGEWRWILYDLDWALYPSTYQWNMIEEVVNPNGHGVGKMFDTTLMCGLMRNETFRDKFIRRYVECLHTVFETERLLGIYDELVAEIEPEMSAHIAKWGLPTNVTQWKSNVATLRGIIEKKTEMTKQHLINTCTATGGYLPRYFGLTKAEMDAYLADYS